METIAYIALGSNLGDRAKNIFDATALLRSAGKITVTKSSSVLQNPAVGGPVDSPDFLNSVIEICTTLSPRRLLNRLLEIEQQLGRERRERDGPRTIDLDIVLFGELVIDEPDLKIPHPRMHQRRFVLEPLAQIAPQLNHPVLQRSVADLLRAL